MADLKWPADLTSPSSEVSGVVKVQSQRQASDVGIVPRSTPLLYVFI
jgi:hypothetical protein